MGTASALLSLLFLFVIVLVGTVVVVAGFIGMGAVFARFTELTLFQATIVTMPVGAAALYLFGRLISSPSFPIQNQEGEWDEWDEWDEELELEDLPPEARRKVLRYIAQFLEEAEAGVTVGPRSRSKRRRR